MRRCFAPFAAALLLAGCTAATSPPVGGEGDTRTGPVYFMPTTRIPLTVSVDNENEVLIVAAGQPVVVPDEGHRYRLNSIYSPFHAEKAIFTIRNGLLNKVDVASDGRLDEIAVAAVKSGFLSPERAQSEPKVVYQGDIDVAELVRNGSGVSGALIALNGDINQAVRGTATFVGRSRTPLLLKVERTGRDAPTASNAPPLGDVAAAAEDCTVGFCYRLPVGYRIEVRFFDGTIRSTTFSVPNGSPIYAAAVNRGLFTKWHTQADLTDGMLTGYTVTTEASEVEALVTLPADIIGAQIAALTQQGNLFNSRATVLKNEIALLKARKDLADARALGAESAQDERPLFFFSTGSGGSELFQRVDRDAQAEAAAAAEEAEEPIGQGDLEEPPP